MLDSPYILKAIARRCEGKGGLCSRKGEGHRLQERHAPAYGKVARDAGVFFLRLCTAILRGFRAQMNQDCRVMPGLNALLPHGYSLRVTDEECGGQLLMAAGCNETSRVVSMVPSGDVGSLHGLASSGVPEQLVDTIIAQVLRGDLVVRAGKDETAYFCSKKRLHQSAENGVVPSHGKRADHG